MAASAETLARINPKWPCYSCISREHMSAMLDLRQFAEAETFALQQIGKLSASQSGTRLERLHLAEARIALGRASEALVDLDFRIDSNIPRHILHRQKLHRVICFCQLDRLDEARKARVSAAKIDASEHVLWSQAEVALVRCGVNTDKKLNAKIQSFRISAQKNNALFDQVELTLALLELAQLRHDVDGSRRLLEELAALRVLLRRPEFLDLALAELQRHSAG